MKSHLAYAVRVHDLALGAHRCARLEGPLQVLPDALQTSALWARGGNKSPEHGEAGLQRALASGSEGAIDLLKALAGIESHGRPLVFREAGGGGGVDVAAILEDASGDRRLLLVDCKSTPNSSLEHQQSQAMRIATAAIPDLGYGEATERVTVVLLARWRSGAVLPPPPRHRPSWGRTPTGSRHRVTEPVWWWFQTFLGREPSGDPVELVLFGRWGECEPPPTTRRSVADERCVLAREVRREELAPLRGLLPGARDITVRARPGFLRASVCFDAKADWRDDSPRNLVVARGQAPTGWWYVGETNDKGVVRLNWETCAAPDQLPTRAAVDEACQAFRDWLESLPAQP